jgi:TM2 domain-containing membrane protein YozV
MASEADKSEVSQKKLIAGILAIVIGSLGVHKFYLGMTTPGVIMLLVSLLTCGTLAPVMMIIGVIEGILYLTKSDEDFEKTYLIEKKQWF